MPTFSDPSQIDDTWLIQEFFYVPEPHTLPNDYKFGDWFYQYYVTVLEIEKVVREYINPAISMNYDIDAAKYKDTFPVWDPAKGGFLWSGFCGCGWVPPYDFLSIEASEQDGLIYASCVELSLEWDWETDYDFNSGNESLCAKIYVGGEEVGTAEFNFDYSVYEWEYSFYGPEEELTSTQFVLKENGYKPGTEEIGY
jgi:hypothetical protein